MIYTIMKRYNFFLPESQIDFLKRISDLTGISVSEIIRRGLDYLCKNDSLNELIPIHSGQMNR